MKIALVHELLTMRGGAEKTLKVMADLFPEAPIYTLLYDERKLGDWFPRECIRFSKLQKYAPFSTNHHLYLKKFPKAVEVWDFSDYDLVISSSSAFAHGIKTNGKTKHLCYVHSPARYLWDRTFDVQERSSIAKKYLEKTFHTLRQWDAEAAERGDTLLAASKEVQRRIELYWRRESDVLYPPVNVDAFPLHSGDREDYYVIASTLVPYKKIDIAIDACNQLKKRLKIIGEGTHRKTLESKAGETVEFLGYVSDEELKKQLQNARAFIFPGEEDFGIAPVEAMACGTPVIAYRAGGALETILEGQTGEYFDSSLVEAIQSFESKQYNPVDCRTQAEKFSQQKFTEGLKTAIASL